MMNKFRPIQHRTRGKAVGMMSATVLVLAATTAQAQTFKVLYSFTGGGDGYEPAGSPLFINDKLCGLTYAGGGNGYGTVFSLDVQSGHLTTLHTFGGAPTDGASPSYSQLISDPSGVLYGTTSSGGTYDSGTVFQIDSSGNLTLRYSFTGGGDGKRPLGQLALDSAGDLYGVTEVGGSNSDGTIFKLDSKGTLTTLSTFGASPRSGYYPTSVLLQNGRLYGTTNASPNLSDGTVFEIPTTGGTLRTLFRFSGADGANRGDPASTMVADGKGNLYGTTPNGGIIGAGSRFGLGIIFKLNIATRQETILYKFPRGKTYGAYPVSPILRDSAGTLYGTTLSDGAHNAGVVFKLDAAGKFTVLHSFSGTDGNQPGGLALDNATGNLYGTTVFGGLTSPVCANGCGTVFEIIP